MDTDIAEDLVVGETIADESIVESDEAKEGATDEAEADAVKQVAKANEVITNTLHINASLNLYRIIALLKCLRWLSRSKTLLNGRIRGAASFILLMNGEEFTWSTFLRKASSKYPPTFKSRSQSFTSFSTSSAHSACWGSSRCGCHWSTSSSAVGDVHLSCPAGNGILVD
ncbi:hypothetical protein L3X38_024777 [Prunus dulcis]|uniref:Uncharacterized protein n=1 Tax=Prunus dulcis TaxID=3755 RepID=A0AAD4Z6U3_PRUDU|nr:hypothetical protein L3X38_024777 [Prunus dulcis]